MMFSLLTRTRCSTKSQVFCDLNLKTQCGKYPTPNTSSFKRFINTVQTTLCVHLMHYQSKIWDVSKTFCSEVLIKVLSNRLDVFIASILHGIPRNNCHIIKGWAFRLHLKIAKHETVWYVIPIPIDIRLIVYIRLVLVCLHLYPEQNCITRCSGGNFKCVYENVPANSVSR